MEKSPLLVGRYELNAELASGGMAVVHLGRLRGDAGFARAVAIKRLHRQYVGDPELSALLLDEARLASRLKHPNVVAPQDLVTRDGEIFVVMEYVHGLTLSALLRDARVRGEQIPIPIVARIVSDVLAGLHSAHEARDGLGRPLALVHRDISPQNIMVGADGLARVLDFGIAQAAFRSQTTREGHLRAKLAYAAPEHVLDRGVDRRADVYSTAIVCWETLTLERLFSAGNESALLARVLDGRVQPGSKWRAEISPELDALLFFALSRDPEKRPASAEEFAVALERIAPPATHRAVARWVAALGGEALDRLAARVSEVEAGMAADDTPVAFGPFIATRTSEAPVGKRTDLPGSSPKRRRGSRYGTTALAVALALVLFVLASVSGRGLSPNPGAAAAVAVTNTPAARPPELVVDAPVLATFETPSPRAIFRLSTRSPAPATARKKAPAAAVRAVSKPTLPPAVQDCSQLTEVDTTGIRRVKRQCLR